jgi:hypothetical protein
VTEGGQSEFVTLGESDSIIQDAALCFKYNKKEEGISPNGCCGAYCAAL